MATSDTSHGLHFIVADEARTFTCSGAEGAGATSSQALALMTGRMGSAGLNTSDAAPKPTANETMAVAANGAS